MKNFIDNKPRTVLAAALSTALMFAAGSALAQDSKHERKMHEQQVEAGSDQPLSDTWITTKVKTSLLADSDVSGLDVSVETVNGTVTLSGDVDNQTQIDRAIEIASGIEGVERVDASDLNVAVGTSEF